jgi:hypothetical protein
MAQISDTSSPNLDKPKYLYPASYQYFLIGQYVLLGISIAMFGDFVLATIFELVNTLKTDEGFRFNARLFSDLGICVLLLIGVYFTNRHKEHIRELVGNWAPMVFQNPVSIRTSVRDSGGATLDCDFETEVTFWFSDAACVERALKYEAKLGEALKQYLEKASHDPVLRRSRSHLNNWINESFQMQDLKKIEIRSIRFFPAPPSNGD